MRDTDYRLIFSLPKALWLSAPTGRHSPCLAGCVLTVSDRGFVAIEGPSRLRLFDQARRFLRVVTKGHGALELKAVLDSPAPTRWARRGRDGWTIIVNVDIAIVPTSLPADLGRTG